MRATTQTMDLEPISVALKFGFIAVLYLFLLWVARSAIKDMRRTAAPAPDATGIHSAAGYDEEPQPAAAIVVEGGGGLEPGARYELDRDLVIGRADDAEIRLHDKFASGHHVRVYPRDGTHYVEDMHSTNGTWLNSKPLRGDAELQDADVIRVGDTELRYEVH